MRPSIVGTFSSRKFRIDEDQRWEQTVKRSVNCIPWRRMPSLPGHQAWRKPHYSAPPLTDLLSLHYHGRPLPHRIVSRLDATLLAMCCVITGADRKTPRLLDIEVRGIEDLKTTIPSIMLAVSAYQFQSLTTLPASISPKAL